MADPDGEDVEGQDRHRLPKVPPPDPGDYEIGQRHRPIISHHGPPMARSPAGRDDASAECQPFLGLSRDGRTAVVTWFDEHGLLHEVRARPLGRTPSASRPDRAVAQRSMVCGRHRRPPAWLGVASPDARADRRPPINPEGVSPQHRRPGDGELRFYPERYAKTYRPGTRTSATGARCSAVVVGPSDPGVESRSPTPIRLAPELATALDGVGIDVAVKVGGRWADAGCAHLVRRVTDDEVEESVCVPPQATLRRLDRADASLDEAGVVAALEADGFVRDPDVLDTWFSSGLWPMSTMAWPWTDDFPETDGILDAFNPTSVLTTAREIITLWVSRMVMFNRYFMNGQLPFTDVFIHAMIQDGHGQKMSKTLGNGVDPRDIIHSHGADAMRFTLVQMTTDTQDVRMPVDMVCPHTGEAFTPTFITTPAGHTVAAPIQTSPGDPSKTMVSAFGAATGVATPSTEQPLARNTSSKFDIGRNFANKTWNATRFALRRLADASPAAEPVRAADTRFVDRGILARLGETLDTAEAALDNYQFNFFVDALYDFVWRDVCDRYLEAVKPTIDDDPVQQVVLGTVLDSVLRILHPVTPFVTEALWPHVSATRSGSVVGVELPPAEVLAGAAWRPWPSTSSIGRSSPTSNGPTRSAAIRSLRSSQGVKPKQRISVRHPSRCSNSFATAGG
ncbi:MAG: class I tRNA ligase family protein [Acidimicrobiales bacterium]